MLKFLRERWVIYKKLSRYVNNVKGSIFITLVTRICSIPISMAAPLLFSILVGKIMVDKEMGLLSWVVFGYVGLYAVKFVVDAFELKASNRIKNRFTIDIRKTIWNNLMNTPFQVFEKKDIGDMKMRLDDDIIIIGDFVKSQITEYIFNFLMAVVHLVIVLIISPVLTVVCISAIPFVFLASVLIAKGMGKVNEATRKISGENYSWQFNTIQKWKEIKALTIERNQYKRYVEFRHKLAKLGVRWIFFWFLGEALDFFKERMFTKIIIYSAGAYFVLYGKLSIGILILFIQYFGTLFKSLDALIQKDSALRSNKPYYDRVLEWVEEKPASVLKHRKLKLSGHISIKDVSFKYFEGQEDILKGISLEIIQGDYIAITGKSGCGKSTLVKLLANLYSVNSGSIEYNGLAADKLSDIGLLLQHRSCNAG